MVKLGSGLRWAWLLFIASAAMAQVLPPDPKRADQVKQLTDWVLRQGSPNTFPAAIAEALGIGAKDLPWMLRGYKNGMGLGALQTSEKTLILNINDERSSLLWKLSHSGGVQAVVRCTEVSCIRVPFDPILFTKVGPNLVEKMNTTQPPAAH